MYKQHKALHTSKHSKLKTKAKKFRKLIFFNNNFAVPLNIFIMLYIQIVLLTIS